MTLQEAEIIIIEVQEEDLKETEEDIIIKMDPFVVSFDPITSELVSE